MDGLNKFKNHNIAFVILDVMLPKLDGWKVCRKIRSSSRVPIIMLTARGEEYDKLFGFELGIDDYIVKPFSHVSYGVESEPGKGTTFWFFLNNDNSHTSF